MFRWEQLSTSSPDWGLEREAGVGSRGKSGSLCLTGHLETSDGDLCQHTVLLCSWQPKGKVGGEQSRTSQTDLTEQCRGCCDPRAPMCSDSADRGELPHRAEENARQGSATPLNSAKCSLEKPKVQAGSSMAQNWLWYRVTDSVGVSTVCYSFSKMLPKTQEQKKCLKSRVLV